MALLEEKTTFQTLNIRGLALVSNINKVGQISDKLCLENSIGILLTNSRLNSDICDEEIMINDCDLFRAELGDLEQWNNG